MSDTKSSEHIINGVRYVIPEGYEKIDYYCKICSSLLYTVEDISCYKKNKACETCYDQYYYNNKEKWNKGWRPK